MNPMVPSSVASLRPGEGLKLLLIGTVFSSFLVPVVIVLLYFSDTSLRRRPVFILSFLSVFLGMVEGAVTIRIFSEFIVNSDSAISPTLLTAFSSFVFLVPPCVQSILLFRVISGCSSRLLSLRTTVALCSPMVVMKGARVPIAAILLVRLHNAANTERVLDTTFVQVLWILQLFDDMYASTLLVMRPSCLNRSWTLPRLDVQKIMRIALASFAVPILLDIAQIVQAFLDLRFAASMYIPLANGYVQIVCVLFATVWATQDQGELISASKHDSEAALRNVASRVPHAGSGPFEELTSPSIKEAFAESIRDSRTAVGEEDGEERLRWLAELGKEGTRGPVPPSLCTAATFDNTGQPAPVFYAV
ncbi:hypothetical protein L227DRAFT_612712 [Lentinus tigrinus ALCF2SS1-6]|uniref:Uncharacterized protein n=1 Tax=Lentinus tigrinus ALCF2SS1-6 TaxID=1328759 RepID=A0A5C2S4L2_9APHY|nr:hypothetical protein L227DRAFT_612712 [Lentinus tigrinus ALCF2SS1-6]